MKTMTLVLLLVLVGFTSCTSEYEERLAEGQDLLSRLELVEGSGDYRINNQLEVEIREIKNEISFLAKVSGNEDLFLATIFKN